jgi:hypothetical protein
MVGVADPRAYSTQPRKIRPTAVAAITKGARLRDSPVGPKLVSEFWVNIVG